MVSVGQPSRLPVQGASRLVSYSRTKQCPLMSLIWETIHAFFHSRRRDAGFTGRRDACPTVHGEGAGSCVLHVLRHVLDNMTHASPRIAFASVNMAHARPRMGHVKAYMSHATQNMTHVSPRERSVTQNEGVKAKTWPSHSKT